jgi:hypothetical protein
MRRFAIAITVFTMLVPTNPSRAQETSNAPTPLHVWMRREAAPFAVPRYTAMITEGKNKFAFLVPDDLYLRGNPDSGTFTLATAAGNSSISFAVVPQDLSDAPTPGADDYREMVLKDYPAATILQEFSSSAAGGSGPGFDLQWKASGAIVECKRIIYISSKAGVLRFTATTSRDGFEKLKSSLGSILQTFHYSTDGVLKVPPLPSTN